MSAIIRPEHPSPPPESGAAGIWRELIVENPMLDQAKREQRRFFRSAYGLGRFGPAIILTVIGLLYVWLVLETILAKSVLKERVDARRWAGALLVLGGVLLLAQ